MRPSSPLHAIALAGLLPTAGMAEPWRVDTTAEWRAAIEDGQGLAIEDGVVAPRDERAEFRSVLKRYARERSPRALVLEPSPAWLNWTPVANIGPTNLEDAPVFLSRGPDDYWIFGRYGAAGKRDGFTASAATLDGFEDRELRTTPFPRQYDAPAASSRASAATMPGRAAT